LLPDQEGHAMDAKTLGAALMIAASYLSGGIPTGCIFARLFAGRDIRREGSGNPGAANVYHCVGRTAGLLTLAADMLKGFLPVLAAEHLFPEQAWAAWACGGAAVAGHIWMVFLRFSGGKGVATTAGVFCALLPPVMPPTMLVFFAGTGFSGHISVGSIAGAAALPFLTMLFHPPWPVTLLAFGASLAVLIKHVPNIKHLLDRDGQG